MFDFLRAWLHRSDDDTHVEHESSNKVNAISGYDHLDGYVKSLKSGAEYSLSSVYQFIVARDGETARKAADAVAEYVSRLDVSGWMKLNDRFRMTTSIEWSVDWKTVDIRRIENVIDDRDKFLWLMRLGTMHPNGFYREKCLLELVSDSGSYMFFLLRLNDWVEEIRVIAKEACSHNIDLSFDEVIEMLPVLERVRQGRRRDEDLMKYLDPLFASRLSSELNKIDTKSISRKYDVKTRSAIYRLLTEDHQLGKEDILSLLDNEKSIQLQRRLMKSFISDYDLTIEELDRLIEHKSALVQVDAMDKKYELLKAPWDGIEKKLLSPSGPVRQTARFICRKHSYLDIRQFYIDHLDSPDRAGSILGLAETGEKEDASLLEAYLDDPDPRIVRNTLNALGELDAYRYADVFAGYLKDKNVIIVKQAYIEIRKHHLKIGAENIYNIFLDTDSHFLKTRLPLLLGLEEYWDRIPYSLMMYSCEDEEIRRHINACCAWESRNVSDERLEWIRSILNDDRYKIPPKVKESVEFSIRSVRR